MEDKVREYNQMYYVTNRDKLRARRRDLYQDPAYREKALARAAARAKKMRDEKGEKKGRGYNVPKIVLVRGESVRVHCVKAFADKIGLNSQTITSWESRGVVPAPTFVDERGRRWYSDQHMEIIVSAYGKMMQGGRSDLSQFKALVEKAWKK